VAGPGAGAGHGYVPSAMDPPSLRSVALGWSPDVGALLLAVVAGGLYGSGVRRLARRGRRWSRARSTAFAAGLVVLVVATCSGLARYEAERFSLHAAQHVLLGMVAPLLLVLGAPVTLTLQAASRPTRTALLRLLHAPWAVALAHPVVAWLAFGGSLIALYATPLLEATLDQGLLHAAVHAHVLVVGVWFCWVTVGVDPMPGRPGYPARLLCLLLALPFHTVVGLALVGTKQVLAPRFYADLADQHAGGGVLWGAGELFGLVGAGILLAQWMGHEERLARREDRRLDAARTRPGP
jgi:putative membrane protein